MLDGAMLPLPDCNRILPRLYQGARPPRGETMAMHGFQVIVLCAEEYQPRSASFGAIARVYHCPFDDDQETPLAHATLRMVKNTAAFVARDLRLGARVYVSCNQGRNRSGLVTALAIRELLGTSGREAKAWVQVRRPNALTNAIFAGYLDGLPAPRHAEIPRRTA
jgi:protein-tyrosine phosphatase